MRPYVRGVADQGGSPEPRRLEFLLEVTNLSMAAHPCVYTESPAPAQVEPVLRDPL